jgi:hypothetical protein
MSLSTNSTIQTQKTMDFRQKFKTEVLFILLSDVDIGTNAAFAPSASAYFWAYFQCAFAHNESELRDKGRINDHYKTKACANFKNHGYCKYGDRCQFLHLN